MKKLIISSVFLFISVFSYSQKNLQSATINNEIIRDEHLPRSRNLMQKSVAITSYGAFHEIDGALDYNTKTHLLLKETGSGYPTIRMIGTVSTPANNRFWDIFGDVFGATINDDYLYMSYGGTSTGFALSPNAKASVGLAQNTSNLHIHELTANTANIKLTNLDAGLTASDGLELSLSSNTILFPYTATLLNRENGGLWLGTNNINHLFLDNTGNLGLGSLSLSPKFQIHHNTANDPTKPHLSLKQSNNGFNGMIKMENSNGSRYFGNYFYFGGVAGVGNNFLSWDYNGSTPMLTLYDNGNAEIGGFTKLGSTAPKIKIKKLTSTTNAAQGGNVSIPHGVVDPSKIISINVLVRYNGSNADAWVANGYTSGGGGYEFDFQYDGNNIFIVNKAGNSANILSKDIKIVVTYEE